VDQLNALPAGVHGLVYLNMTDGVTQSFTNAVNQYAGNPNLYGFYLADEPDPTGQYGTLVSAANLKAESDYIHAHVPGAKTFITMMNMGPSANPTYANTYNPANTHIDLFGLDPYPIRSDMSTPDYNMIDKAVAAAEASGIPQSAIVPVFQSFGGGNWADDSGGHYVMPTAAQEQTMMAHWAALVPNPAFDYAYAWGSQNGDTALGTSSALQSAFLQHNTATSTTASAGSTAGATTGSAGSTTSTTGSGTTDPATSSSGSTTHATGSGGSGTTSGSTTAGSSTGSSSSTTDSSSGHHHHGLDFSSLASSVTTASSTTVPTSTPSTSTTATSGPVHVSSSDATGGDFHHVDLTGHHTDHHAWHYCVEAEPSSRKTYARHAARMKTDCRGRLAAGVAARRDVIPRGAEC
jgi:hypothetical protein